MFRKDEDAMPEKIISPEKARQGGWGVHALAILIGGLILTMIAWYIVATFSPESSETAPAVETTTGPPAS